MLKRRKRKLLNPLVVSIPSRISGRNEASSEKSTWIGDWEKISLLPMRFRSLSLRLRNLPRLMKNRETSTTRSILMCAD